VTVEAAVVARRTVISRIYSRELPEMCPDQPQNATAVGVDTNSLPCRQIRELGPMHLALRRGFAPNAD
jgi:hypothetical protein